MPAQTQRKTAESKDQLGKRLTLTSQLRRCVVRLLNGSANPILTEDLAGELGYSVERLTSQLHVLREYGIVTMTSRAPEGGDGHLDCYWESAVRKDRRILDGLVATAGEDDAFLAERRAAGTLLADDFPQGRVQEDAPTQGERGSDR